MEDVYCINEVKLSLNVRWLSDRTSQLLNGKFKLEF
jgi:hypothetical protein